MPGIIFKKPGDYSTTKSAMFGFTKYLVYAKQLIAFSIKPHVFVTCNVY